MSGHNKWSKIKHKKAASDAQKSKIFSKHVKSIQVEARRANGNIEDPGLKAAIDAAKKDNMPKDNIERAIQKALGGESGSLERITYEAYGPGGVALMIEALTDSRNRTAAELRHLLSKHGVEMATPGAAAWAFAKTNNEWEPKEETLISLSPEDEEKLGILLEALDEHDDVQNVFTNDR